MGPEGEVGIPLPAVLSIQNLLDSLGQVVGGQPFGCPSQRLKSPAQAVEHDLLLLVGVGRHEGHVAPPQTVAEEMGRDGPAGHDDLHLPPVKLRHLTRLKLQRHIRFGPALLPAHDTDVPADRGLGSLVPEFLESQEDGVADPALLSRQMFVLFQKAFDLCLVLRGENGSRARPGPSVRRGCGAVPILGYGAPGDAEFPGHLPLGQAFHVKEESDTLDLSHLKHPFTPANWKCSQPPFTGLEV